jgi:hypothetical protein
MSGKTGLKQVVIVLSVLAIVLSPSVSYARGGPDDRNEHRTSRYDDHNRSSRYGDYHRSYRYYEHPRFGISINYVSPDYTSVFVRGVRYYYYDGLYYVPSNYGYVLTRPPYGAVVRTIPPDFRAVVINGRTYFVDNGVYYLSTNYGYEVVMPPVYVQAAPQPVYVSSARNQTKVAEGSILGAILGALAGGIVGHQMKGNHDADGALLGGVAGAVAGGVLGSQVPNEPEGGYSEYPLPATEAQPAPAVAGQMEPATVAQPAPVAVSEGSFPINVPNQSGGYTLVVIKRSGTGFVGPQGEYYPEFPSVAQLQVMYGK